MPASTHIAARRARSRTSIALAAGLIASFTLASLTSASGDPFPGASRAPKAQSGWESFANEIEQDAPFDEAQGGFTSRGTPVAKRNEACFPTDARNLFWQVDMLPTGPGGELRAFDFHNEEGVIPEEAREAIRGQNTWMLWSEGNEAFWGWLFQERSYGITDFLILIDSRKRSTRFKDAGLINQPGMKPQTDPAKKILGLYLDQADGENITLTPPKDDIDARTGKPSVRPAPPPDHASDVITPGDDDAKLYRDTLKQLATDGVDPNIYGYPSGVLGLRLFPNPDFFGATEAAFQARRYWKLQVEDHGDDYYDYRGHIDISADPLLVRPFRVSMTCAFCHVSPHPLNPPKNPEEPKWANLSSLIGAQYWDGSKTFSNLKDPESFLYQIVASWQPGTLDTSLVISDQINNPNTMNAVFELPARIERAKLNPSEGQSPSNLRISGVEQPPTYANARHTPRVLLDGTDSVGVFGALARVYLNVGAYSEQWRKLHNPILGIQKQRPFEIATMEEKSVYWRSTVAHRIPELVAFLTYANKKGDTFTAPMKLASAPEGKARLELEAAATGREVFVENCAICHSSKQPEGFAVTFSRDWAKEKAPAAGEPARFVLPMDFAEWEAFKLSVPYQEYVKRIKTLAGAAASAPDRFLEDNYLSSDIRIPVTLVGTNSSRAVGTNAMRGQIWDNFSSETYKNLPAVGAVHFYNPYSGKPADDWGNNDVYYPPAGGPGYYRPASLVSIWATAPFLHNNALGRYTHKPSVDGRLEAFDDAVDKLLWKAHRPQIADENRRPGDLRAHKELAGRDPGFIYRTTARSWIDFPPKFIRIVLVGAMGEGLTSVLTYYLWLALGTIAIVLVFIGVQRYAGFALLLAAILVGLVLRVTHIDTIYPSLWWIVVVAAAGALLFWLAPKSRLVAQLFFALLACAFFLGGAFVDDYVAGLHGPMKIGPIPQGTPVNLIQSLNPQSPPGVLIDALSGLTRGLLRVREIESKNANEVPDKAAAALHAFEDEAGLPLLRASKCPDFVLDRGHWFAEGLSKDEKEQLKAFLKTL